MFSTHRDHGHLIAKGGHLPAMMAELMGRQTGCSRGCGGSMHMFESRVGFMGGNGIVSGGLTLAPDRPLNKWFMWIVETVEKVHGGD